MMDGSRPKVPVMTAGGAGRSSTTISATTKASANNNNNSNNTNSDSPTHDSSKTEPVLPAFATKPAQAENHADDDDDLMTLEYEDENADQGLQQQHQRQQQQQQQRTTPELAFPTAPYSDEVTTRASDDGLPRSSSTPGASQPPPTPPPPLHSSILSTAAINGSSNSNPKSNELVWLVICFLGIMASFVCYGLLLEYTTSGGRKLHELSFLFVTSGLYTLTAAAGRYVRDETPTTIPPARFAILGITSMGSTFCSVRSLRYVIYPIQVLAKSCKPVPVMIMGTFMGKRYPLRKYINVVLIVLGVALFMGGGDQKKKKHGSSNDNTDDDDSSSPSQLFGILLLFISLCFDGGTGAYEDKLMSVHSVQPFDLMYNIQLGKTILAGIGLLVFNQMHIFIQMCQDMGFLLVALGLSGALGQVFIFVTIAKFGALTCSIIGLARKVTTLVASIYFYGHSLNSVQFAGLVVSVTSMVMNFWGKKKKGGGKSHGGGGGGGGGDGISHENSPTPEEMEKMLGSTSETSSERGSDLEMATRKK